VAARHDVLFAPETGGEDNECPPKVIFVTPSDFEICGNAALVEDNKLGSLLPLLKPVKSATLAAKSLIWRMSDYTSSLELQ
jgi:hypothetical protein